MSDERGQIFKESLKDSLVNVFSMLLGKEIEVTPDDYYEGTKDFVVNQLTTESEVVLTESAHKESGGKAYIILKKPLSGYISNLMVGVEEEKEELTPDDIDALVEAMNQVLSSYGLSLKEKFGKEFTFEQSKVSLSKPDELFEKIALGEAYISEVQIKIGEKEGKIFILLAPDVFGYVSSEEEKEESGKEEAYEISEASGSQIRLSDDGYPENIKLLLDVELPIVIRIGSTEMKLKDIMKLGIGSIVQLDKPVDEPVELLVNDKLIAKGEVVVVDSNFAIRIIDIESREERIKSLGE